MSTKLRAAYETDLQAMAPQSMMFPGLHPAAMMSTVGLGTQQNYRGAGYSGSAPGAPATRPQNPPQIPIENSYLYIPNAAVGAVIGGWETISQCKRYRKMSTIIHINYIYLVYG